MANSGTHVANAARVTPGSLCKKEGVTETYKGKIYKCIKLGKKLYWNNGKKIQVNLAAQPTATAFPNLTPSPSQSTSELFTFFYKHTNVNGGGPDDELTRVTIDANNRIVDKKIILKVGLQTFHDWMNGQLLLSAGNSGNFYLIAANGEQVNLNIKTDSGIPSDSRKIWIDAKFHESLEEILFWDFDRDLYSISNLRSSSPTWTKIISGTKLADRFGFLGLDKDKEWLDDFVVLSKNRILLATSNNSTKVVHIWLIEITGIDAFQIKQVAEFRHMDWSSSLEMSLSPDKTKVAYKYSASELTPNFRISVLDTKNFTQSQIATDRYYEGYIGPITFVGNDNLLLIPALIWNSDPNGGRVICRLDLRTVSKCQSIQGVSGLNVKGTP
jgi:hypothetical protein